MRRWINRNTFIYRTHTWSERRGRWVVKVYIGRVRVPRWFWLSSGESV